MADLAHSPLHDRHVALGAKLADFGGWEMPIEYPGGGVVAEHTAVRERVGIFDVSHLGKATVTGPGAADFVNACFTNDLRKIGPGQAQYTMCCDESGGVVDDLIQYLRADDEVFLIPNAANTARYAAASSPPPPRASRWSTATGSMPSSPSRAPAPTRCSTPWGCRPGTTTCSSARPTGKVVRSSSAGPATQVSAATSSCPGGRTRRRCGTPSSRRCAPGTVCRVASVPATRCGPRWVIPCTVRTCRWTSPPSWPGRAGRSAGPRTPSGVARPCWPRRPPRRRGSRAGSW
jgi:hypothetical protein